MAAANFSLLYVLGRCDEGLSGMRQPTQFAMCDTASVKDPMVCVFGREELASIAALGRGLVCGIGMFEAIHAMSDEKACAAVCPVKLVITNY